MSQFTEIFDRVKLVKPKHNKFDKSHSVKLTANFGELLPVMVYDALPSERVTFRHECAVKLAPMIAPIMSEIDVKFFSFKIPYRLVWDEFRQFITKGEDGTFEVEPPHIMSNAIPADYLYLIKNKSLSDYLEFPSYDGSGSVPFKFNALPFRAYQLIYQEYFRDQNLEEEYKFTKSSDHLWLDGSGDTNAEAIRMMQKCHVAWRKDYFTSALPWTQRGPIVTIPIEQSQIPIAKKNNSGKDFYASGGVASGDNIAAYNNSADYFGLGLQDEGVGTVSPVLFNANNLYGMLANVESSINDLRAAYAVQRWYERNALGGSRYIEQLNAHFGVRSSDARLQRPEFLGMTTFPVIVNEVLQQSQSTTGSSGSPLGQPAGHAFAYNNGNRISTFCEEHSLIITLMAIVPKAEYFQGMPRKYMRKKSEDYYWPAFAHLGEDVVYNGELKYQFRGSASTGTIDDYNTYTFGYQSRYADYKFSLNRVHGDFRDTLDFWHLARKFDNVPVLNADFVHIDEQRDGLDRIWAYEQSDFSHFWVNLYNHVSSLAPIPVFSTPI